VFLVETRGHLFFRWEDTRGTLLQWPGVADSFWVPPDRFNVEGSGEGIAFYPDAHYMKWPQLWKESDFQHGRYYYSATLILEKLRQSENLWCQFYCTRR